MTSSTSPAEPIEENGISDSETSPPRRRRWLVRVLIGLASLVAVFAALNTWVERQLLDTDGWVDTSDQLLANEEIRSDLATFLVDELYANTDIEAELGSRLPDDFQGIAGPIAALMREPATAAVDRLLASDEVRSTWQTLNRAAHEALVRVLKDETRADAVSTGDGSVTLDLSVLVQNLAEDLGLSGELIEGLPDDAGQVTILESDELEVAQEAVELIDKLSVILFILVVGLYGAAIYLATGHRREAVRSVGWALAVSGFFLVAIHRVGVELGIDALAGGDDGRDTTREVLIIATDQLRQIGWAGVTYGLIIALFAGLVGPSKLARAIRQALSPVITVSPLVFWLSIIGLWLFIASWSPGTSQDAGAFGLLATGLFIVALELLRRQVNREFPEASLGQTMERFWDWLSRSST
ncbi:MAG: hypothetical protein OEU32_08225 [Acidimicrobiia bacterium]|nr:hypothetical protein [Acidimicrobiia bacterium]